MNARAPHRLLEGLALQSLAAMALLAALAGCASLESTWYLNGRSEAEFRGHDAYCIQQANESTSNQNLQDAGRYTAGRGQVAGLGAALAALGVGGIAARHAACLSSLGYTRAP